MAEAARQNGLIRAAGGVVLRLREGTSPEVAVVHRVQYGDWTLPKGKLEPGESEADAALREVEEETGLRCRAVRYLDTVRYSDRKGRPKTASYWLMVPVEGELRPDHEIDDARWVAADEAASVLSYPRDAEIVAGALRSLRDVGSEGAGEPTAAEPATGGERA
jgi:8-oxo-dGTP diphosphatase